jgi:hypothetical protein
MKKSDCEALERAVLALSKDKYLSLAVQRR